MKNLVSVLVVTHNSQKYIYSTLNSCLQQEYQPIEILIFDNNSSDNTVDIIHKLKTSKVKVFKSKRNIGPYGGLNYLINKAKGKYIAVLDHDDLWLPPKLKEQVNYLDTRPKEICCGTQTYIYYEHKNILILDKKPLRVNYVNHISLMFRNIGFKYDEKFTFSDEHFEKIVLGGNSSKIHCIPNALSIHRIRSDRNNFSRNRYKLNMAFIKEYFSINPIGIKTLINFIGYMVFRYSPTSIEWMLINIVKRRSAKYSLKEFKKMHPNLIIN
ncbi:MAG: glycosyltransferase family 2 protein [Candidatus Pacebacteria bacterium]|nr:glycosyltransferase family 2 protein [Candidatus Paceibacterota bacterium]